MNFTRQSRPLKDNINNAIVNVTHAVPMKDGAADGSNDLSINRVKYIRTTSNMYNKVTLIHCTNG